MHGDGKFLDGTQTPWEGIFVNGGFDSKVQKLLRVEKHRKSIVRACRAQTLKWFTDFFETFQKSDKKTYKDNLATFFAKEEEVAEYYSGVICKYEEKLPPEKWKDLLSVAWDGREKIRIFEKKKDSQVLKPKEILSDQIKDLSGGQFIEIACK